MTLAQVALELVDGGLPLASFLILHLRRQSIVQSVAQCLNLSELFDHALGFEVLREETPQGGVGNARRDSGLP